MITANLRLHPKLQYFFTHQTGRVTNGDIAACSSLERGTLNTRRLLDYDSGREMPRAFDFVCVYQRNGHIPSPWIISSKPLKPQEPVSADSARRPNTPILLSQSPKLAPS